MFAAPPPSGKELEELGFTAAEVAPDEVMVWAENWPAVAAFGRLMTQWMVGMSGATGIAYPSIPIVLEMSGIDRKDWPQTFDDIRVMEQEALACMRERRGDK